MRRLVDEALAERPWDAIVFDSICSGWALGAVARHRRQSPRPPRIVYIAHNHEITVGAPHRQGRPRPAPVRRRSTISR